MRLHRGPWFLAAGLVAGGLLACQSRSELRDWFRRHQFRIHGLEQALPCEVYFLETNRWLEFDVPKGAPLVRLLSNASLSAAEAVSPGAQWPYAIEYQVPTDRGPTNTTGVYHFNGELLEFQDKHSGEPVEVNSYLDRRFRPLSARNWTLNLREPALANARTLRLRLHSRHPALPEVGIRVYFQTKVPARKTTYLWNRLSDDQKRDLARGNVYSFAGLNDREKASLLRYHWAVASPEGIPGRDFEHRILYVRDDYERLQLLKSWEPAGIVVDPDHCGVVPVTNAPGACRLELTDGAPAPGAEAITNLLLWHGQRQQRLLTNHLVWSGTNEAVWLTNSDGLLHLNSSRPIFVRAFQAEPGRTNEITPEPMHVLTFTASPTQAVEYRVDHAGPEPTLFRVEVRRFVCAADGSWALGHSVRYALLTQDGEALQAGDVALTNGFSPYAWLVTTNGLTNISHPQSLCFILPPVVRALRITSPDETIFVNAYSRPSQLVKRVQVPEDYSPARALTPEEPSWFTVRPPDHQQRREAGQTSLVRVQPPLPEFDPLVQAGQYEWESFLPEPEVRGQMVLLPPSEGQALPPDSLPFAYFPVAVGETRRVRLRALPWAPQVEPNLALVFGDGACGGTASVKVDGRMLLDNRVETPVFEVRLGRLTPGEHELGITASGPLSAYLNYLEADTAPAYLQRFCVQASSNAFTFPLMKRGADSEVFVLKVFSPSAAVSEPFSVRLKLKNAGPRGLGPFPELTFLEREARVTPGLPGRTRLVATRSAQLDDGQPVFLPLGPDLAPGPYQLEVRVTASSPRWLSLSRTTPGLAEKITFYSQLHAN